jgi:hypothetical protein
MELKSTNLPRRWRMVTRFSGWQPFHLRLIAALALRSVSRKIIRITTVRHRWLPLPAFANGDGSPLENAKVPRPPCSKPSLVHMSGLEHTGVVRHLAEAQQALWVTAQRGDDARSRGTSAALLIYRTISRGSEQRTMDGESDVIRSKGTGQVRSPLLSQCAGRARIEVKRRTAARRRSRPSPHYSRSGLRY